MASITLEDLAKIRAAKMENRKRQITLNTQVSTQQLAAQAQADLQEEQLSLAEDLAKARMAHDEKVRKETERTKEKAQAKVEKGQPAREPGLGEPGNDEPILEPPQQMNPQQPSAGPTLNPSMANNYGQPGGPQPGSPGQQGGQLDPFLMQSTVREGRRELMPGVLIPDRQVTTRVSPNSVSAGDALMARAASQRAQAEQMMQAVKGESSALAGLLFSAQQGDTESASLLKQHIQRLSQEYPPEVARQIVVSAQGEMAKLRIDEAKYQTRSDIAFGRSKALSDLTTSRSYGLQASGDALTRAREMAREARRADEKDSDPTTQVKRREAEILLGIAEGNQPSAEDQAFLDTRAKLNPMERMLNTLTGQALSGIDTGAPTAPPKANPVPTQVFTQEEVDAADAEFAKQFGREASASEIRAYMLGRGQ